MTVEDGGEATGGTLSGAGGPGSWGPGDAVSTRRFAVRDLCRGALVAPGLTLVEEVGRGGCGVVWSARWVLPSGIEKRVAVKRLRPDAADGADPARRLRDEARLLARISHRAIVRVEDVLLLGATPAILTEYVDGLDLGVLLDRGALPPRAAAELLSELASALEAAHAGVDNGAGVIVPLVHRDIKPANVRLTRWGEVKLLDFGAAHAALVDRESATRGFLIGSPGYLAPEALLERAGPAADIYALGVLAWECRIGERLGRLSSQRLVQAEQVDRALARLPEVTWAKLVTGMMAWDPTERPSAAVVRSSLEQMAREATGPSLRAWAVDALGGAAVEGTAAIVPAEGTASLAPGEGGEEADHTQTQVEILPAPVLARPLPRAPEVEMPRGGPSAPAVAPDLTASLAGEGAGLRGPLRVVAIGAGLGLLGGLLILTIVALMVVVAVVAP